MKVFKVDRLPKRNATTPLFTGPVTNQDIVGPELSKNFLIRQVNFEKGIRNKFHLHNYDQVLIVTEGKGIVATDEEKISVVPGDVIFIPAGRNIGTGLPKVLLSLISMSCRRTIRRRRLRSRACSFTPNDGCETNS